MVEEVRYELLGEIYEQDIEPISIHPYQTAFYETLAIAGIPSPRETLKSIEAANRALVIEAELDDTDGEVELPPLVRSMIDDIFPGANILIDKVVAADRGGMIQVALGAPSDWRDGADSSSDEEALDEEVLIPPREVLPNVYIDKQVYFDLTQETVQVGTRKPGEPAFARGDHGEWVDTERWDARIIPPDTLADFVNLPCLLDTRRESRLSTYKQS